MYTFATGMQLVDWWYPNQSSCVQCCFYFQNEQSGTNETQKNVTKKRKRKSTKKKVVADDAKPSTSGTVSKAGSSKTTTATKATGASVVNRAVEGEDGGASSVKVSVVKEKANGKQFIKERPKLPPPTLEKL